MTSAVAERADRSAHELCVYARAKFEQELTPSESRAASLRLLDTLGVAVIGSDHPTVDRLCSVVLGLGGTPDSTVIGRGKCRVDSAAFLNSYMARHLELNDAYYALDPCHPSDVVMTAFAVGQAAERTGEDVMRAVVVGYGLLMGLCEAGPIADRGWDHATYGGAVGALVTGLLLELDDEQLAHALSLAVVPGLVLRETRSERLSNWKGIAFPNAMRNGVFASLLARAGITGVPRPFEGRYGFVATAADRFELSMSLDRTFVAESHLKLLPVVYHAAVPVEIALELRSELDSLRAPLSEIAEISVSTYDVALAYTVDAGKFNPRDRETADHSLPFLVALALAKGAVTPGGDEVFLDDADVRDLMTKTTIVEDPRLSAMFPPEWPARVEIRLRNGHVLSGERPVALGHAARPASRGDVEAKLERFGLTPAAVDRLAGLVDATCDGAAVSPLLDELDALAASRISGTS